MVSPAPVVLALALLAAAPLTPASTPETSSSTLRDLVEQYTVDRDDLDRFYGISISHTRLERLDRFAAAWHARLAEIDRNALDVPARVDLLLVEADLAYGERERELQRRRLAETAPLMPFAERVVALEEARWRREPVDARVEAGRLADLVEEIEALGERVRAGLRERDADGGGDGDSHGTGDDEASEGEADEARDADADVAEADDDGPDDTAEHAGVAAHAGAADHATDHHAAADDAPPIAVTPVVAQRAAGQLAEIRRALSSWHEHRAAFDPLFAWWTREPYEAADAALGDYVTLLREEGAGLRGADDDPLVGDPIGRVALLAELEREVLAYTPEELLGIGEREFRWCEEQMRAAATELGFGDWRDALEHVKQLHVEPGAMDALVARQAEDAIAFVDARRLVTIPELCREAWRLQMLSSRTQRVLPFAAYSRGQQAMLVAYATDDMDHETKLMAMRGNNEHFSRIVTPHELIPGHHLQGFMAARHASYRAPFSTPFYGEGWALYWEMRLWELGYPRGPEDRIGMLFWRMHRAARIVISLRFHLGEMEPDAMIDFLVERVGHERHTATSEVRRYVGSDYGPLYQCAYMIGGLQIRALHRELVESGEWDERGFHDAVLRTGPIPIERVRALLTDSSPEAGGRARWRFDD